MSLILCLEKNKGRERKGKRGGKGREERKTLSFCLVCEEERERKITNWLV